MIRSEADRLSVTNDNFSIKVTLDGSRRFFVRSELRSSTEKVLVFTEFILEVDETLEAISALKLVCDKLAYRDGLEKIEFHNIYPGYSMTEDKGELVRRHDQLVEIVELWAEQMSLPVTNSYLDREGSMYMTHVFLS